MSDLNNTQNTQNIQNEKLVFRKPPDAPQGMKSNQTKVSFIESKTDAIPVRNSRNSETSQEQSGNQQPEESGSKIRRMSDSTRAKEAEKSRKNLRKGKNSYAQTSSEKNYTYQKERPDGDYSDNHDSDPGQNPDPRKSRKRRKFSRQNDVTALASETLHLDLRDIVPVAVQKPEPVRPVDVEPAPRAAQTSLNLSTSSQGTATPDDLDVTIRKTPEEAEKENIQRQKASAMMQMENVEEIKSDIKELRNAIFFRTMALMLVALISGYLSVRSCFHLPWLDSIPENLIALMQLLLGLAAGSVCMPTLRNGFTRLIQLRADTDSLSAIALGACLLDAFFGIFGVSSPLIAHYFMPCAVLILIFHTMGKLLIIDREERNLNEIDKCYEYYGLQVIEDEQKAESLARGILHDFPIVAAMRKTEYLKEFRRYTYSADIADHFCHYAAPAIFAFSLVASIAMAIFRQGGISYAVSLFSMFSVACGCAAITFVTSLPLFKATKDLTKSRALLLGYQSIDDFYDTNSLMLDAAAMFPMGSIQLQGVKMFSNVRSDEILLAAASLARYAGSAFRHIFDEVLHERSGDFYPVENYIYEDSLGLCGWIHNQRVLLGNRELMIP
ncbi:MAG: hypothetical protein K2O42_09290, partial [Oscillospiraceae bacterium]|nr:hypothetical protein [Oscillospiraceae bacterium]